MSKVYKAKWKFGDKSVEMREGDCVLLSGLENVIMGLGWKSTCDLDGSVQEINLDRTLGTSVFFQCQTNLNGSIQHSGDDLTGEGSGDDERIHVNLKAIDAKVGILAFVVNVYTPGKHFGQVKGAYCRLFYYKAVKGKNEKFEICKFKLTKRKKSEGIIIATVQRCGMSQWSIRASGQEVRGRDITSSRDAVLASIQPIGFESIIQPIRQEYGFLCQKFVPLEQEIQNIPRRLKLDNAMSVQCKAVKVDKMDLFGKSDPYFVIKGPNGEIKAKSETIMKTLDPVWPKFVSIENDLKQVHTCEVYDWDKTTADDLIGKFTFVPDTVIVREQGYPLINEKKKLKKPNEYTNSGTFVFDKVSNTMVDNPLYLEKRKIYDEMKALVTKWQHMK